MSWFQNNPLGLALAGFCSLLVLVAFGLSIAWKGAAEPELDAYGDAGDVPGLDTRSLSELGPISEYQVFNDRPVFNESRRPVVAVAEEPEAIDMEEAVVADAPDVRLTGVIITPDTRVVSLSPVQEGKPLIVREGSPLEGEYVGWSVGRITPRGVQLESSDGESLALELTVHDKQIAKPPKPEPVREPAGEGDGEAEGESGETLSRAEEIRRRIQERREQLRAEAAEEQAEAEEQQADRRNQYQEAIRAMMSRDRNKKDEDKESD